VVTKYLAVQGTPLLLSAAPNRAVRCSTVMFSRETAAALTPASRAEAVPRINTAKAGTISIVFTALILNSRAGKTDMVSAMFLPRAVTVKKPLRPTKPSSGSQSNLRHLRESADPGGKGSASWIPAFAGTTGGAGRNSSPRAITP
jgi:hypothetical protein